MFFILFVRRLARFIGSFILQTRTATVLKTLIIFIVFLGAGLVVLLLGSLAAFLVLIPSAIAGIAFLVMYVLMIDSVKAALSEPHGCKPEGEQGTDVLVFTHILRVRF